MAHDAITPKGVTRNHGTELQLENLTRFNLDLAAAALSEPTDVKHTRQHNGHAVWYGIGLKIALQGLYGEELNHGRMYPNLDGLVDDGLFDKREIDKRTNAYVATETARELLAARGRWFITAAGVQNYTEAKWLLAGLDDDSLTQLSAAVSKERRERGMDAVADGGVEQ